MEIFCIGGVDVKNRKGKLVFILILQAIWLILSIVKYVISYNPFDLILIGLIVIVVIVQFIYYKKGII